MHISPRRHLFTLFQHAAEDRSLRTNTITLDIDTVDGAQITIRPGTPWNTARYLRHFLYPASSLFERDEISFHGILDPEIDEATSPSPITFRCDGVLYDQTARKEYVKTLLHLQFFRKDAPSAMSFDFNFAADAPPFADDGHSPPPHSGFHGPTAMEFIKSLEKADENWHNLYRDEYQNVTKFKTTPHLRLVPNKPASP